MDRVPLYGCSNIRPTMTRLEIPPAASGPWPAPAKLNLFLHVTGRRADGYHTLQTVFQFLERTDRLYFVVRPDPLIRRFGGLPGIAEKDDLSVRAAHLLQAASGSTRGVDIHIDKCLPAGGGLGGGSSDAATTLWALNLLWETGLERAALAALGLQLGADVPVFIHGTAAWAEGVGEVLTPVSLPEPWYLVLVPPVTISTADIFSDPQLTRDTPRMTIPDFLSGSGHNDCEAVVRRRHPEVAAVLDWLDERAAARMTGTGACVFAAFESETLARAVHRQVPAQWAAFVARGCNHSPLLYTEA